MGLPWSIEKIRGWRSHYDAVQRWHVRCEKCYSGDRCVSEDFEDFFLAFMVACYHLRDFVIETGGVRSDELDRLISNNETMRICRDICNRSKHHTISRFGIDDEWSLGREHRPWPDGTSAVSHFLIAGNKKYAPLEVAHNCMQFWDSLIASDVLVEPPNPFGPPKSA